MTDMLAPIVRLRKSLEYIQFPIIWEVEDFPDEVQFAVKHAREALAQLPDSYIETLGDVMQAANQCAHTCTACDYCSRSFRDALAKLRELAKEGA